MHPYMWMKYVTLVMCLTPSQYRILHLCQGQSNSECPNMHQAHTAEPSYITGIIKISECVLHMTSVYLIWKCPWCNTVTLGNSVALLWAYRNCLRITCQCFWCNSIDMHAMFVCMCSVTRIYVLVYMYICTVLPNLGEILCEYVHHSNHCKVRIRR